MRRPTKGAIGRIDTAEHVRSDGWKARDLGARPERRDGQYVPGSHFPIGDATSELDRLTRVLIAAWEAAEGRQVNPSYVATFCDMARAVMRAT